jgi:hypothetical protein
MALLNNVLIAVRSVATYNLHCESKGSDNLRYSQLDEFLQDAKRYRLDVPVIPAGDFDFGLSQDKAATALADAGFHSAFTTLRPATTISRSMRGRMIDWILIGGPLRATNPHYVE